MSATIDLRFRVQMRTIEWMESPEGGAIVLLDQRLLPLRNEEIVVDSIERLIIAIKNLSVRGAPALGVTGALGVALILAEQIRKKWSQEKRDAEIHNLRNARPTAVNLAWGVDQVIPLLVSESPQINFEKVLAAARELSNQDESANHAMGKLGADFLLKSLGDRPLTILTHCNTGTLATTAWGTALGVIRELHSRGKIKEVFVDETRPLLQGSRLTAFELQTYGIPYRILPDGAAASAIFSGLIDAALIGADRIALNGDSANKIGSLGIALAAHTAKIPFLVVAPESTVDRKTLSGADIEIEFRGDEEVVNFAGVAIAPPGSKTYNPAFDVTPAQYISGIVTEKKIYYPQQGETL